MKEKIKEKPVAKEITSGWYYILRIIAIASIATDYLGRVLYLADVINLNGFMFTVLAGSFALPVFAFLLAESFYYTKKFSRHLLRLGLLALISEPLYDMALVNTKPFSFTARSLYSQNAVLTLFLAFLMLKITNTLWNNESIFKGAYKKERTRKIAVRSLALIAFGATFFLSVYLGAESSWEGILLVTLFAVAKKAKHTKIIQMIAILFFILTSGLVIVMRLSTLLLLPLFYLAQCERIHLPKLIEKAMASKPVKYMCRYFYPAMLIAIIVLKTALL